MPTPRDALPTLLDASPGPSRPREDEDRSGTFPGLVAALLSRTLADRRVRAVLHSLAQAGLDSPEAMAAADLSELVEATRGHVGSSGPISPSGMKPVQRLAQWVEGRGGMDEIAEAKTESLRDDLIGIRGIGPGAADAILLIGLSRAVYPIDRATYRVLARHGWIDSSAEYDEARSVVEGLADDDPRTLADLALGFGEIGRAYCKPGTPKCDRCPLQPFLPEGGPYDPGCE